LRSDIKSFPARLVCVDQLEFEDWPMKNLDWCIQEVKARRLSRRDFIQQAMVFGLSTAAAASLFSKVGDAQAARRGGTVTIATNYTGAEETFDLTKMNNTTDAQRSYQVYNRLLNLDRNMKLVPNLATEWEAKPGAKEWSFVLRSGVEFHNGKTLDAEDVVYSISEHIKDGSKSPAKPYLQSISEVRADGKNGVRIVLSSGNADLPYVFAHDFHTGIVPKDWKNGDPVVGTGPYKLVEFRPGQRSVTSRFANYWKSDAAWVESFVTQGIPDSTARISALQSGSIDVLMSLDPKLVSSLSSDPSIKVAEIPSGYHMTFAMACDRAPTNDINVRLALKNALDRKAMVETLLRGHGLAGNDIPVNPAIATYCRDIPQRTMDPDKAAFYWKKSGLSSIELIVSPAVGNGVDAGLIFQAHARKCGIQIDVKQVPADGYLTNTWLKVPFCVSGWNARPTADLILALGYQSNAPWNETHWQSAKFDSLLADGRVELDEKKREAIYCEAERMLYEEGGVIVPFFTNYIDATRSRIHNFAPSPAYQLSAGWMYEEAWVDA
jgi:peptide/nickel transport system substrate-binding protein